MARKQNTKLAVVEKQPKPILTPAARAAKMLSDLIDQVERDALYAQKDLDKWAASFSKNPASAFEWSRTAFEAAARKHVAQAISYWIDRERNKKDEYTAPSDAEIIRKVQRLLYEDVVSKARWPERSTSSHSNEMTLCINARKADVLVGLDSMVCKLDEAELPNGE